MQNQPTTEMIKQALLILSQATCVALYGQYDPMTNSFDNTGLLTTHPDLPATKKLLNSINAMTEIWKAEGIVLHPVKIKS